MTRIRKLRRVESGGVCALGASTASSSSSDRATNFTFAMRIARGSHWLGARRLFMGIVGTFFSVTDRSPAQGDFKNLTQGLARVGTIVVAFRVFSNGERAAVLDPALRMFRTMRNG